MKSVYEKPISEIEKFKTVDIVTTSYNDADNDVNWGE